VATARLSTVDRKPRLLGMTRKGDAVQLLTIDLYAEGYEYVTEHRFHPQRKWRFDVALPAEKLAIEIDGGTWIGGRHTSGAGYEKDCEKLNAAVIEGWRVLRFTSGMVRDGRAMNAINKAMIEAWHGKAGE
jgi:very-short-patch-repair endonuclease